jgi:hypothetical protein
MRKLIGKLSAKIPKVPRGKDLLRCGALPLEDRRLTTTTTVLSFGRAVRY